MARLCLSVIEQEQYMEAMLQVMSEEKLTQIPDFISLTRPSNLFPAFLIWLSVNV